MSGILDDVVGVWIGLVMFALPVGGLWAVTLIGITFMTAREFWKGRSKRRRRKVKQLVNILEQEGLI